MNPEKPNSSKESEPVNRVRSWSIEIEPDPIDETVFDSESTLPVGVNPMVENVPVKASDQISGVSITEVGTKIRKEKRASNLVVEVDADLFGTGFYGPR